MNYIRQSGLVVPDSLAPHRSLVDIQKELMPVPMSLEDMDGQDLDIWTKMRNIMGGVTAFDADLILLADTATFDEGDDGNGTAVDIEPGTAFLVEVAVNQLGAAFANSDNTLDVTIEFSDDAGSTYRAGLVFPRMTNASVNTNGQKKYYGIAIAPPTAAGEIECLMRAVTDAIGTGVNVGTTGIRVMGFPAPGNFPTGIVGFDLAILPTRRLA